MKCFETDLLRRMKKKMPSYYPALMIFKSYHGQVIRAIVARISIIFFTMGQIPLTSRAIDFTQVRQMFS